MKECYCSISGVPFVYEGLYRKGYAVHPFLFSFNSKYLNNQLKECLRREIFNAETQAITRFYLVYLLKDQGHEFGNFTLDPRPVLLETEIRMEVRTALDLTAVPLRLNLKTLQGDKVWHTLKNILKTYYKDTNKSDDQIEFTNWLDFNLDAVLAGMLMECEQRLGCDLPILQTVELNLIVKKLPMNYLIEYSLKARCGRHFKRFCKLVDALNKHLNEEL